MPKGKFEGLSVSERYVVLALAADRLVKGYPVVFNYFGPLVLKKYTLPWIKLGLGEITQGLYQLEEDAEALEDSPPIFRRTYLISQIRSLRGLIELGNAKLKGKHLLDAVRDVLDIEPPKPYDLDQIAVGENEFQSCFNRRISNKSINQWIELLKTFCIKDIVPHIFHGNELSPLIESSQVRLVKPKDGHPPCYYIYHGAGRGTVCVAGEHKENELTAIRTLMHELYPGHHLYYLYRETLFNLGLIGVEAAIDLIYSSETPINEGVAETTPVYLVSLARELREAINATTLREHYCKKVLYNVWHYRFVDETMSEEDAATYIREKGGFEGEKIERWLGFIDSWRIYYPSYPVGIDLLKKQKLFYLYLPKSMSSLNKLIKFENEFNIKEGDYEKDSREAILHNA